MFAAGACAAKNALLWAGLELRQFRTIVLGEHELKRAIFAMVLSSDETEIFFYVLVFCEYPASSHKESLGIIYQRMDSSIRLRTTDIKMLSPTCQSSEMILTISFSEEVDI